MYLNYGEIFNCITEVSFDIRDIESRSIVRRAAADAQSLLYEGLVQTVVREFPELDPHKID